MSIKRNLHEISNLLSKMKIPEPLMGIEEDNQRRPLSERAEPKEKSYQQYSRRHESSVNPKEYAKLAPVEQKLQMNEKPVPKSAAFNDSLVVESEHYLDAKERREAIEMQRQTKLRAKIGYFGYE